MEGFKVSMQISNDSNSNFIYLGETCFSSQQEIEFAYPTSLTIDYYFEKMQTLLLTVTSSQNSINKQIKTAVGTIMGGRRNTGIFHEEEFTLAVMGKSIANENSDLILNISCPYIQVNNSGVLFYIISNFNDKMNWRKVYKSEEKQPGQNWDFLEVELGAICLGDSNNKVKIEIFDSSTSNILDQGVFIPSEVQNTGGITLESGTQLAINAQIVTRKSFVDLLYSGLQISLVVAIDFTLSNGQISNPNSLHYINSVEPNAYERAIRSCGTVIAYYDYDHKFPLLGFGGIPRGGRETEHSFPLNYNFQGDPCVNGIDEMVDVYKKAISWTQLSGPTYFSHLLRKVNQLVRNLDPKIYTVVMILTDGILNDMDATIDAIIEASSMPISIVIIGIGKSDFTQMEILDGDEIPLSNTKGMVQRDIVQFVEFSKHEGNSEKLAEEILKEIPKQVEDFYKMNKIF